jgi:hypothetical protein
MHGLKSFMDCEVIDCESCLKYIERTPIIEKRGNWISQLGPKGSVSKHGKHRQGYQRPLKGA